MFPIAKPLVVACIFLMLARSASVDAAEHGFMEGHLKIVSSKEADLADGTPPAITSESYAEYPLIILSAGAQREIARVTPDENGNYRAALPPGTYILDVQGRVPRRLRAKPEQFTVLSNQTVRVDMSLVIGFR